MNLIVDGYVDWRRFGVGLAFGREGIAVDLGWFTFHIHLKR